MTKPVDTVKCPYACGNRTAFGYCGFTVCTNPEHNGSGTFVFGKTGLEKYVPVVPQTGTADEERDSGKKCSGMR